MLFKHRLEFVTGMPVIEASSMVWTRRLAKSRQLRTGQPLLQFFCFEKTTGNDSVAQYNFITPDSCSPLYNRSDTWLAEYLPAILKLQAYRDGGAIFIAWDEAGTGDGPIGMMVLSPLAKGNGYSDSVCYDH